MKPQKTSLDEPPLKAATPPALRQIRSIPARPSRGPLTSLSPVGPVGPLERELADRRPVETTRRLIMAASAGLFLLGLLGPLGPLGCSTTSPVFEDVKPAEELYADGLSTLAGQNILGLFRIINYDAAIESFQAIIDNYPYSEFEQRAQLKIADAYFEDGRFEEALAYYQDFSDLHPQHPQVPFTLLRAAQCHYNQIESVDRDQSATHEATTALEILIEEHPYAEETRQGEEMLVELRTRLALNMLHVADFYLDRTHWQSAAARYRRVLDEFPGLGMDARALYRLGVCLENMRREDEALRLYHVVVENYGGSSAAESARARIARAE